MSDETKSAADLRREVEEKSRLLAAKQHQMLALMKGEPNDKGEHLVREQDKPRILTLEAELRPLTDEVNALKFAFLRAKTEEDVERNEAEPFGGASIFNPSGGQGVEGAAAKSIQRLPESLGDAFVNSAAYKSWIHGSQNQFAHVDIPALGIREFAVKEAMKATFTTSGFTSIEKMPDVVMLGQQMLTVADLFAQATTNNTTVRYLQENTFTAAATEVAEEGLKPEQDYDVSEVDAPVRKIAVFSVMTNEMFEDYPAVRDYVNQRLPFSVRKREELQILNGNGSPPNLQGVLGTSGVLTQAKGSYSNIDAIYLGITKVRTQGFFEPDAIVIDPTNWSPIRLAKTTTGEYIYGDPSMPGPETIFGKRVVVTVNMVDNTCLVGAFRIGGTIFYRQGIRVEATNSDQNDFIYNRIKLRAEQREALAIWHPPAFCKVTGLDSA